MSTNRVKINQYTQSGDQPIATVPDLLGITQAFLMQDTTQTLTNKTGTDTSNAFRAAELGTSGANVSIVAAPPIVGQVLSATSATRATWQTITNGGVDDLSTVLTNDNQTGDHDLVMSGGSDTLNFDRGNMISISANTQSVGAATASLPDLAGVSDIVLMENISQILTKKTGTDTTNAFRGTELGTTGDNVSVVGASPPTTDQVLIATTATTATWQTISHGGEGLSDVLEEDDRTVGHDIIMSGASDKLVFNRTDHVKVDADTQSRNSTVIIPDIYASSDVFVIDNVPQTITSKTGTDNSNTFRCTELGTTGANVNIGSADPPVRRCMK